MISRLLPRAALMVLSLFPVLLSAQLAETTANEDERIEALIREQGEFYRPKSQISVGFRMLSSGVNVKFGNLGVVTHATLVRTNADGTIDRFYDNGSASADAARANETAESTTKTPDGRYQTFGSIVRVGPDGIAGTEDDVTETVQTGDLLSYQAGFTRNWSYATPQQATDKPGYIAMNTYSAASEGGVAENKQGKSGGVELQYAHVMRRIGKRMELSFVAGMALNGINNKAAGDVTSALRTVTDYYSLNGQPAPALPEGNTGYTGPSADTYTNSAGDSFPQSLETTTVISDAPVAGLSTDVTTAGGTTVHGRWQVKGAYFMMRVGPSLKTQLTERLGLSASLGLAGAYAGTRYSVTESFDTPNTAGGVISTADPEFSDQNKFLGGYYADVNLEWMANETTGFFGGVSAQKFGGYDQELNTRTARVDLGSSVGLRGGITIKF